MTDLSSTYMGLALANPLIASASPLSSTVDGVLALADAGVGAIVLHSLFEEQLRREADRSARLRDAGSDSFPESGSFFPSTADGDPGPRRYLSLLERASATVAVPVIASLNGVDPATLALYARSMESAGAAAIELNICDMPGNLQTAARDVEQRQLEVLAAVREAVSLPIAVKLSPYFSSVGELALALDAAGADALVLFTRFLMPDIDPGRLAVSLEVELSHPADARLPRAWIALLRGRVQASLAGTSGVESADDIAGYLLAGADAVMSTSALLRHGPSYATVLLDQLRNWMRTKGFVSVDALRGMLAVPKDADATEYERAGYVAALRAANAGAYRHGRP